MSEKPSAPPDKEMEIRLSVPGGRKFEVSLLLRGAPRALEELLRALGGCSSAPEVRVSGGSCCWSFSRNGTTVHLVVDEGN